MPYTQKGRNIKNNKKKTKRLRGGREPPAGPARLVSQVMQANLHELTAKTQSHANEDEEYELKYEDKIDIGEFDESSNSKFNITEIPKEKVSEEAVIPDDLKKKLKILEEPESTKYIAYTNSKDSLITITKGDDTSYIDLNALNYSKTLDVILNDEEIAEEINNNWDEFETLNPKIISTLSMHLPLNFFEAVFSSDNLTKVTFKHTNYNGKEKEAKISGIDFNLAGA